MTAECPSCEGSGLLHRHRNYSTTCSRCGGLGKLRLYDYLFTPPGAIISAIDAPTARLTAYRDYPNWIRQERIRDKDSGSLSTDTDEGFAPFTRANANGNSWNR